MVLAVTFVVMNPFDWPPTSVAVVAVLAGWLIPLGLAPWRQMTLLNENRRMIAHVTRVLRRLNDGPRDVPLKRLLIQRHDEMGELSRAIHDALTQAMEHQTRSRLLQRRMDDTIKRETTRATARLHQQAHTDPLTGLANRRALNDAIDDLPLGAASCAGAVAMVVDVDHFKRINDSLGHELGDACLQFLGSLLKTTTRHEDIASRLGGDEFVVVMPYQTLEGARALATRLRALFAQMPWSHAGTPRPTLSIGLAASDDAEDVAELLRRADKALYASKHAGRDTMRVAA
jgi:diguanylate cyclase (GGDEF)-like protein